MSEDTPSKDGLIFFESPEASRLLQMGRNISKANATVGSTSLGQFSINSTDSLVSLEEPDDSLSSRSIIDSRTRELIEKAAKADRKLESQMLIEYVKDYQMIETKSPRTLLKTSQGKRKDEGRLSLANAEKFVKNLAQQNSQTNASTNQIPDKTPSNRDVKETPRIKRDKKVSLNSQFRRKSCHCSECGGMSKLELKAQNIVKAANKHLEWVQYIRKKNKQKVERQKGLFLNLPQFNTLVLSRRESKEGTPRSMTSKKTGQSSPKSKFFSVLSRHSSRNLLLTRGSETPLRKTKNEILEEAWSAVTPNQYMIKIFTPLDADKDIVDEDSGREDPKKEEEQAKSLGSPVLAKRASKQQQQQQKPPKQRRKHKQPTLYMEEPFISSRRSSIRPQTTQENQTRPQVLIQKYVATADRADSPEEFYDKMDVEVLDMNTKRDMWEKIGQVSPKFKRIFGDKLYTEEPREYNDELGSPLETKPDGSRTSRASLNSINKIYSIYRPLPKLKIPSAKPKCTTTSSRVDTAATNEVNPRSYRAGSYQVTSPGPLERLHSIEAHLPSMEIASPSQAKSETLKNLFSIYASPKTTKSSTKHKHTFSEIQSSRLDTLVLPSNTATMTNIQLGNPIKGHRKNLSINTARIPSANNKNVKTIESYRESQIKTVTSPNSRRAKVPAGRNLSTGLSTKGNKEIQLQKK